MPRRPTEADSLLNHLVNAIVVPGVFPRDLDTAGLSKRSLDSSVRRLREMETRLRRFRKRLEALQAGDDRKCPACGKPVAGRTDKVYCSTACRIRAHRGSQVARPESAAAAAFPR